MHNFRLEVERLPNGHEKLTAVARMGVGNRKRVAVTYDPQVSTRVDALGVLNQDFEARLAKRANGSNKAVNGGAF